MFWSWELSLSQQKAWRPCRENCIRPFYCSAVGIQFATEQSSWRLTFEIWMLKSYKQTKAMNSCSQVSHVKTNEICFASFQEVHDVCAKNIILATPKDAVENMDWRPMRQEHHIERHTRGLEAVPALRIFFTYKEPWWEKTDSSVYRIVTDLPIRQVQYIGGHIVTSPGNNQVGQEHVLMVANLDAGDTEYFTEMISRYKTRHKRHRNCTQSRALVRDITSQLSRAFDIDKSEIPEPSDVIIQEWNEKKGGVGWHVWKRGVKWTSSPVVSLTPLKFEHIYLVGSSYCGGQCALWMEGALRTVDRVLRYFGTPSWFSRKKWFPKCAKTVSETTWRSEDVESVPSLSVEFSTPCVETRLKIAALTEQFEWMLVWSEVVRCGHGHDGCNPWILQTLLPFQRTTKLEIR